MRKIIHIDMDAFFASVEQLDDPSLIGKPVAVGGSADRGVVAAASYEARKFGVRSAMSSKIAARLCPELIFVKPRFSRYKEISLLIHSIFERYTDLIEPLSLDEAFLDVTENKKGIPSATFLAQSIRTEIRNETGLIASAGVSYNKFLAKMASDQDKPDGLYVITEEEALAFIDSLPIERFFGVGKVTAEKLHELQIYNGKHLRQLSRENLLQYFGKAGGSLYDIARGIDERAVVPDRERKSIAVETTFRTDIFDTNSFRTEVQTILSSLWERYRRFGKIGKSLTIKVKSADFTVKNRSKTKTEGIQTIEELNSLADELEELFLPLENPVRLIGFQISGFIEGEAKQLSFEM